MIEQAVLALLGSLAGIGVARLAMPALVSRIPSDVPRAGEIALDWGVLMTVLAVSIAVAVMVAVIPAMLTARPSLQPLLRQSRGTDTRGRRRALGALVSVQIALAVVLGIGAADAAIVVESAARRSRVPPEEHPDIPAADHVEVPLARQRIAVLPVANVSVALPGVVEVGPSPTFRSATTHGRQT